MTKLIYLHIPKSGGTSQRTLFFDLYGRKNVLWHGARQPGTPTDTQHYDVNSMEKFTVIGGHRPISYYLDELDALYVSVVREPVSRIISLYSYYTKPQFAEDYHEIAREEALINWKKLGIDTESLVNSINTCARFREEIENYQCRYLSRYDNSFDGVIQTLNETEAVICDMESTTDMNSYLSGLFGWGQVPRRKLNSSKEKTHDVFRNEPGLKETLTELIGEDLRLYEFIRSEHRGVFSTLRNTPRLRACLKASKPFSDKEDNPKPWKQVQVYTKGFIGIHDNGTGSTGVIVVNYSALPVDRKHFPGLSINYTLHDIEGKQIGTEVFRQALDAPVPAKGKLAWNLEVEIPTEYLVDAKFIQVGLSAKDSENFADHNPLHAGSAYILRQTEISASTNMDE